MNQGPALQSSKVVFLGDSLTFSWPLDTSFPGGGYINKGINGNSTPALIARFDNDVIALKPGIVLIWAGTNDIANGLPTNEIADRLQQLYQLAITNNIRPIACTIPPMRGALGTTHNLRIADLNQRIRTIATTMNIRLADYQPLLTDNFGELALAVTFVRPDGTIDEVHLNAAGYTLITPVARQAIRTAND
jgi:acyl-CoA thioesterase I